MSNPFVQSAVSVRVLGVGNEYRADDGVGPYVARRLAEKGLPGVEVLEKRGEPASLLEAWKGSGRVYVVDAMHAGEAPGAVLRFEASTESLPAAWFRSVSSHAMGLAEAVELARALGRLPGCLTVFGIEGRRFDSSSGLTPEVKRAADRLVLDLCEEIRGGRLIEADPPADTLQFTPPEREIPGRSTC